MGFRANVVRSRRQLRLAVAIAIAAVSFLPATARAAANDLGPIGYGTMVVDDARGNVYVSGPTAGVVDVLDFAGTLRATVSNLPGATGMALNGRYLYVAETSVGAIARIDLDSGTYSSTQLTTGLLQPQWLALTGGKLWTTVAVQPCCGWGALVSVDPKSGRTKSYPQNFYSPDLATSPGAPGVLFLAQDGLSPGSVYELDVTPAKLRTIVSNTSTDQQNIEGLAVSPDGTRVIPASGYPYAFEELSGTTMQPDGIIYPGQPYPSAVAVSPGRGGLLATGLDNGYSSPDIAVYPLGSTSAIFTASTLTPNGTANVLPHGLALSADGRTLFAATGSDPVATNTIFNAFPLP